MSTKSKSGKTIENSNINVDKCESVYIETPKRKFELNYGVKNPVFLNWDYKEVDLDRFAEYEKQGCDKLIIGEDKYKELAEAGYDMSPFTTVIRWHGQKNDR